MEPAGGAVTAEVWATTGRRTAHASTGTVEVRRVSGGRAQRGPAGVVGRVVRMAVGVLVELVLVGLLVVGVPDSGVSVAVVPAMRVVLGGQPDPFPGAREQSVGPFQLCAPPAVSRGRPMITLALRKDGSVLRRVELERAGFR